MKRWCMLGDCECKDWTTCDEVLEECLGHEDCPHLQQPDVEDLVDRVKELEAFIGTIGPCGLAISHDFHCPNVDEAIKILEVK